MTPREVALADLVARADALADEGSRRILGITGAPGAGKSHLAHRLAAALGPARAVVVPMDGFHLAGEVLDALGRTARKGAPDTFDGAGYAALLRRLREQVASSDGGDPALDGVVLAPRFHREIEEPVAGGIAVRPEVPLVITEGNYLLRTGSPWSGVRPLLDEVWFLAPPDDLRRERLVARHEAFGRSPAAAREHALGSDEVNARGIVATADGADLVVRLLG
ncbi:nucleoside/nucleotide kinase family protein [Litorihabitans aurantiacus]|uniref:Nucleoside/nucleotide kinase family protein n=1 Tax=Litorihabitans aurantiacus TaxID=1930061 RepID=A0AA37XGR8_9MICO|nr:nucleoside/nucleotide kinase family protein [Litorihabitans aurantiacus]GMA32721.1 nucleoside/nucleotide kinase family protein [Litorihabitans aurantiacus]